MDTMEIRRTPRTGQRDMGVAMTAGDVEGFLADMTARGRAPETVERYRRSLERLSQVLPEDGRIRRGTLDMCRQALIEAGCAPRSVNVTMSAANSYLAYMGHREYQARDVLAAAEKPAPELTRGEYKHLLQTARLLDREKTYLLVKLFASADMPVQELSKATVEAVKTGTIAVGEGKSRRNIRLPRCLAEEMLAFAGRNGIYRGPLFRTREGAPMNRSYVTASIRDLCEIAQVSPEKGSPRCLRKLYLAGRKAIEDNIAMLVDQALERQMEEEQLTVGWESA